ncbi:hypothetical protein OHB37_31265 (plasmid) [Streptomyces albidoflavus]|nr:MULTISPECIES: hypothetical protein [Streptomyces]MCX4468519.1 hypothetical protein [Streptomyces albidoflavus]MYX51411.1 hypothetical protein [Streptomyces sp. SID8385]WSB18680.1 hypothetical protein OHB37_31265 [Streptomyces albidoflavus]
MTFRWETPPWERSEDSTHMAVVMSGSGDDGVHFNTTSVRGDDAVEGLADLLMGPGGAQGAVVMHPGLIGVVVKKGIDVMWMARPPIHVEKGDGQWQISIEGAEEGEVHAFSAADVEQLLAQLKQEYT